MKHLKQKIDNWLGMVSIVKNVSEGRCRLQYLSPTGIPLAGVDIFRRHNGAWGVSSASGDMFHSHWNELLDLGDLA